METAKWICVDSEIAGMDDTRKYFRKIPGESMGGKNMTLEFAQNTYMLEYQDGAYLCNDKKRVEAPLNLVTLEEAVRQCPKLKQVLLDDSPFGDQCFSVIFFLGSFLRSIPKT